MHKVAIAAVVSAILAGCDGTGGGSAPPTLEPHNNTVVMMSDSITAHWFTPADASPTLDVLLPAAVDDGVAGQVTSQMYERFQTEVLDMPPAVVIIEGGTNDLVLDAVNQVGFSQQYLYLMAEEAQAAGIRVLMTGIPWTSDPQYGVTAQTVNTWNTQLRTACETYGWTFVDFQSVLQLSDGSQNLADFAPGSPVHPNAAGYTAMWPVLERALKAGG